MRKTLNIITIITDAILIIFYVILKLDYYLSDLKWDLSASTGTNAVLTVIWIPVSILITTMPLLIQIATLLFLKFKKQMFAFLIPLGLFICDIGFEFISLLGAAMNLDESWADMATKMLMFLPLMIIPLILSLIAMIAGRKKSA